MEIEILNCGLTVCKVASQNEIPNNIGFCFTAVTDEEFSLVCPTDATPQNTIAREDGWRAFRICGTLDFSLVGILSKISSILAEAKIGIFAVSTYNTDYILVKEENLPLAINKLKENGYAVKG